MGGSWVGGGGWGVKGWEGARAGWVGEVRTVVLAQCVLLEWLVARGRNGHDLRAWQRLRLSCGARGYCAAVRCGQPAGWPAKAAGKVQKLAASMPQLATRSPGSFVRMVLRGHALLSTSRLC